MTRSAHPPGPCRRLVMRMLDQLEGDLSPRRAAALERHLAGCTCCADFAASLRRAIDACRLAGRTRLPAAVRRRAEQRMRALIGRREDG